MQRIVFRSQSYGLLLRWLVLAAVGLWIHFASGLTLQDDAFLAGFLIALGLAWSADATVSENVKAFLVLLAIAVGGFWYLQHEVNDLRACVKAGVPAERCHTIMNDFERDPSPSLDP